MIGAGSTLLIATRNRGKSKEFREAFQKIGVTVKDLHDVEGIPDIEETGTTFADNAFLKAKAVADLVGLPVLADDSGLCVDALDGEPGIYSARYAGEAATDENNNAKLLRELKERGASQVSVHGSGRPGFEQVHGDEPESLSAARFVCVLVLYDPADDSRLQAEGFIEGHILSEARGNGGFGYDPLFWLPRHKKSMSELTVEEKNAISHRGQALQKLLKLISEQ